MKHTWITYGSILVLTISLVACGPEEPPAEAPDEQMPDEMEDPLNNSADNAAEEPTPDQGEDGEPEAQNINEREGTGYNTAPEAPYGDRSNQEVAQRLSELATEVEGVNAATSVVLGQWAVVGIDLDEELDRERVGNIKYTVAEALKADPKGAYAVVTADPDTQQRLEEMNQEIQAGKPVEGIMEELSEIVGRLMPQVPRDIDSPEAERNEDHQGNS